MRTVTIITLLLAQIERRVAQLEHEPQLTAGERTALLQHLARLRERIDQIPAVDAPEERAVSGLAG